MTAEDLLRSVRNALVATGDGGLDAVGVAAIVGRIDTAKLDSPAPSSPRELHRSECAEPSCPWFRTDGCRRLAEHRQVVMVWRLVGEEK